MSRDATAHGGHFVHSKVIRDVMAPGDSCTCGRRRETIAVVCMNLVT
jgi:hypothetical protein